MRFSPKPLWPLSRRIPAAFVGVVTLLTMPTPQAAAFSVTADTAAQLCRVDPQSPSKVRDFWDNLENDARSARIAEIDKASPGFAAELQAYESGANTAPEKVAELQKRITDAGGQEGLGMLIAQTASDVGIDAATGPEFQTEYTEAQARAAAEDIGDDPAAAVAEGLNTQASNGMRIDALRAELFSQRTAAYNSAQQELKDNLAHCADELESARPTPWQYKALFVAAIVLVIGVGIRAWINSRKPSRHQAK